MSIYQLKLAALDVASEAAAGVLRHAFRRASLAAELAPTGVPLEKLVQVARRDASFSRAAGWYEHKALGLMGDRT